MPSNSDANRDMLVSGNKEAFEQIYREHMPHLFEYGLRKCQNKGLVEDCIQDLFVKLWDNRKKLSGVLNMRYYLLISLKNLLINAENRERKFDGLMYEERFLLDFNLEKQFIKNEDDRLRAEKMLKALQTLTPKQREVIYLRYFEELSYEDISVLMNISVKGLYKLHYRALDALKEWLSMPKTEIVLVFSLLSSMFLQSK